MSESRAIGPERCAMISQHGAGRFVRGSRDIDNLLRQGWTIVPNDFRNHLLPERQDPKEEVPAVVGIDPVKTETTKPVEIQEKKRPRIQSRPK